MTSSDGPRRSNKFASHMSTEYTKALFSNDAGMWTVFEIVKRPILMTDSEGAADHLISRLKETCKNG